MTSYTWNKFRYLFHRDERGVAMTEFVMFLPAWVVTFVGVFALGKLGVETTKVKMLAQRNMWDGVIAISDAEVEINENMSPRVAGPVAAAHLAGLVGNADNPQQAQDGVEAVITGGGLGLFGHWGESYARVKPFELIPISDFAEVDDLTFEGKPDILNDRDYPAMLLDDSVPTSAPSGGLADILSAVLGAAGFMPALGAGVRYGTVFGEIEGHSIPIAGGQTMTASAHYDILVSPVGYKGAATEITDMLAYALMQTDDKYRDLFYFGENNYGGTSTSGGRYDVEGQIDDSNQKQNEEISEAEEEFEEMCESFDNDAQCQQCTDAGFDDYDDCFPED